MKKFLVIIPAYNEEKNIGHVVEGIRRHEPSLDILVVNDGSTDSTSDVLRGLNVDTINLPFNLGYGGALQTGFKYAVEKDYDFVVQFDADGQHLPEDIKKLLRPLFEEDADIVVGSRFMEGRGYKPSISRRLGMILFGLLTATITKQRFTDVTSGFQALSKKTVKFYSKKGNYPSDFPDADVLAMMSLSGFKIVEVSVKMFGREKGESMHSGYRAIIYVLKMLLSIFIVLLRKREVKGCL
ncbi:MAG: glycosyltransferase family 2 protein [Thermodesulfobacteriota bacterium]